MYVYMYVLYISLHVIPMFWLASNRNLPSLVILIIVCLTVTLVLTDWNLDASEFDFL